MTLENDIDFEIARQILWDIIALCQRQQTDLAIIEVANARTALDLLIEGYLSPQQVIKVFGPVINKLMDR